MRLDEQATGDLQRGAALLGTGGGGANYLMTQAALHAVRRAGPVRLLAPPELSDDALLVGVAMVGSPVLSEEYLPGQAALTTALGRLEQRLARRADALVVCEVGGLNALYALVVAANAGLPLVDGDGMGRALPELQMISYSIYGVHGSPCVLVSSRGDVTLIEARDDSGLENLARGVTYRAGGVTHMAGYAMSGRQFKETGVLYTVSLAVRLGAAMRRAGSDLPGMLAALQAVLCDSTYGPALVLGEGQVTAVERPMGDGLAYGSALIRCRHGRLLQLHLQNEFLLAELDGRTVATVPDLISVIDAETLEPVQADQIDYGQQVVVLGIEIPALMRTPAALRQFGPRCFGYDSDYRPLSELSPRLTGGEPGVQVRARR